MNTKTLQINLSLAKTTDTGNQHHFANKVSDSKKLSIYAYFRNLLCWVTEMGSLAAYTGLAPSERAELEWLLESGALGRSANLVRVLRYICEETAAGRADQIKEYSIAVEALGRKPDFDPQSDTIVRVTVHTLRKRLQDLYETGEGISHPVRLIIPAGGYAVQFLHLPEAPIPSPEETAEQIPQITAASQPPQESETPSTSSSSWPWWIGVLCLLVVAIATGNILRHKPSPPPEMHHASAPISISGPTHILLGDNRHSYTDHSGNTWSPQSSCEGGESLPSTGALVAGTDDSYLYDGGLRGFVRCIFRAPPGFYELHLYFAEPSNLEPAERVINLLINAGLNQSVDVVDRAGGDHIATTYTIAGVRPENDGTIHLDFTSEASPINAVEILPAPTAAPLPLRLVAAPSSYKDEQGLIWQSDNFYRGGRFAHPPVQEHSPDLGLYASGRIGNFQYSLPAPVGSKYRVTLYFREAWFGQANGTPGGVGSRVFDVYANGRSVLQNFDILADGHGANVAKTLEHIVPTPQGQINLQFVQVANYPLINAIEVVPEQP